MGRVWAGSGSERDAQHSRLRRTTLERHPEIVGMLIVILSWTVQGSECGGRGDPQAARPNAGVIRVTHPEAVRAKYSAEGLHRGRWGGRPAVVDTFVRSRRSAAHPRQGHARCPRSSGPRCQSGHAPGCRCASNAALSPGWNVTRCAARSPPLRRRCFRINRYTSPPFSLAR
jgi:hypothetical protein